MAITALGPKRWSARIAVTREVAESDLSTARHGGDPRIEAAPISKQDAEDRFPVLGGFVLKYRGEYPGWFDQRSAGRAGGGQSDDHGTADVAIPIAETFGQGGNRLVIDRIRILGSRYGRLALAGTCGGCGRGRGACPWLGV